MDNDAQKMFSTFVENHPSNQQIFVNMLLENTDCRAGVKMTSYTDLITRIGIAVTKSEGITLTFEECLTLIEALGESIDNDDLDDDELWLIDAG